MSALPLLTRGMIGGISRIIRQVEPVSQPAKQVLAAAIDFNNIADKPGLGIHQSDIIIRTGLIAALADMRANPWTVDYVFQTLQKDSLSKNTYGEKEIKKAKEWFLKTNIPVFVVPNFNQSVFPCITIKLMDSAEVETTLGDVHFQPQEEVEADWPNITDRFSAKDYDSSTGILTVPDEIGSAVVFNTSMTLLDAVGREYQILEVLEDSGKVRIAKNLLADFGSMAVRPPRPSHLMQVESVIYRESYQVGVHVSGEPVYLTWLHSIVSFALHRYKAALLEARGLERTVFSSSDFDRNEINEGENIFSRFISLTGFVRQSWPKAVNPRIGSVIGEVSGESGIKAIRNTSDASESNTEDGAVWKITD